MADLELLFRTKRVRDQIAALLLRHLGDQNEHRGAVEALGLGRCPTGVDGLPVLYEPSLAFIIRGTKHVSVGEASHDYDEGSFLLSAVALPAYSWVATPADGGAFLSVMLRLDAEAARLMLPQLPPAEGTTAGHPAAGMAVGPATPELFEALRKLIELLDHPQDIPFLSELIQREILYRVLTGPTGATLRRTLSLGTSGDRTVRALDWLRRNFAEPVRVEALADLAGMAVSTFHHRFRELTAMSPLQYQKQLRLHEARRLMLGERMDAGTAALRVGYESATQFTREYRRLFGAPPMRDVRALRRA